MNRQSDNLAAGITVRRAELSDSAVLAALMGELGYATRPSEMEMRLEAILADARYQTLVAVRQGKVCGMIGTFYHYSYEHNNPGARIMALVVGKEARGQGIGRELVRVAENDLIAKNIKRVAVNTRFERAQAHLFYERVGYVKNGFRFFKSLPALAD